MLLAGIGFCYNIYFSKDLFPAFFIAILLMLLYTVPLWPIKQLAFTRRTGFLKTVLLAFTWAYITVILPVQQSVPVNGFSVGFLFSARFLFMLMLCIIFDSRDSRVDKIRSLRSLATDVSKEALSCIMRIVFTLFIGAGFLLRYYFNDIAQVIAFFITGLMTMLVYRLSLKNRGYLFYYFLVDGLMLFSAVATFVASI